MFHSPDYLRARIRQEDQLAASAADPKVGQSHAELALTYRQQLRRQTSRGLVRR
jgi:hypothetical protein